MYCHASLHRPLPVQDLRFQLLVAQEAALGLVRRVPRLASARGRTHQFSGDYLSVAKAPSLNSHHFCSAS